MSGKLGVGGLALKPWQHQQLAGDHVFKNWENSQKGQRVLKIIEKGNYASF